MTPVSSKDCSSCNINGNEAQLTLPLPSSFLSFFYLISSPISLSLFLIFPLFLPFQCVQTLNHVFITEEKKGGRESTLLNAIDFAAILVVTNAARLDEERECTIQFVTREPRQKRGKRVEQWEEEVNNVSYSHF